MPEQRSLEQQYNKLQEINNELKKIDDQPLQQELIQQTDKLKKARQNYDEFWSANKEDLIDTAYMENSLYREFIDFNLDFAQDRSDREYKKVRYELDQARAREDWDQVGASAEQLNQLRRGIKMAQDVRVGFGMSSKETYSRLEDATKLLEIIGQTLSIRARNVFKYLVERQGERCLYIDLPFKRAGTAGQPITQQEISSIKRIISQIRLVLYSFLGKQGRKLVLYNQKEQYCLLQNMREIEGIELANVKSLRDRFEEVYQYFQEYPKVTQEKIIFNYLLEHRGQFVATDSLIKLCYEQTGKQASLGAISVAIVTLRQRLGDNLKHPFILIKQKRAYCLVPPEGALIPGEVEPKKDETSKKKL